MMVAQSVKVINEDGFLATADQLNLTPMELLTVASLVEQEGLEADFAKVARVVYNRIKVDMRLQFDSTTQYWLIQTGKGRKKILSSKELKDPANNYSTTTQEGLPPTPISNPGKAALDAASHPAEGSWLYFVVTEANGTSSFADTLPEHERNIEKCRAVNRC